jgi:hypothetical protein
MTSEQFTYWLQGFMEINDPEVLGVRETQIIKDHLASVFNKQTPVRKKTTLDQYKELLKKHNTYTEPNRGTNQPQPIIRKQEMWEWDAPKNPYTVTCTDSNPFNDKFGEPNNTLKPGNTTSLYSEYHINEGKRIC